MKSLAILGASGHGKVIADSAECVGWTNIVFYDDAWPKCGVNGNWPVIGNTKDLINNLSTYDGVVVAIGNNQERMVKQTELLTIGASLVSIIHPNAQISKHAEIGIGSVVMAGAVINIGSKIGVCCIVNTGAIVDHDCVLGDGVHISPGAHLAGGVIVGDCSWIGIGANVKQFTNIGSDAIIGAGAVVLNDIENKCTAAGVPAKILSNNN